jgi:hydroxymethylpyrimidine/phosphomethylpyrimidine kinase
LIRVLVVGGLDPSGGAGLVADLETLSAIGVKGYALASAVTAQGPRGVRAVAPVPEDLLLAQIDALFPAGRQRSQEPPRAVKTGMLGNGDLARVLAKRLGRPPFAKVPIVVDPVLIATAGTPLFDPGRQSVKAALEPLLERAALITPNLGELEVLTGRVLGDDDDVIEAARELPYRAILVKGGHRKGEPVDILVSGRQVIPFTGRRRPGTARGTGCRLASAIAGFLGQGAPIETAVRRAKRLVERYLDGGAMG